MGLLVMNYKYTDPDPEPDTDPAELKLYQAFIFSVPIIFAFILLFLFYLFYLRRRRVDWSSLRMRTTSLPPSNDDNPRSDLGLKKELREMLPIIVFKESFSVRDTQCSVCLGDYQAEDRLQQIPACGHTFHMECIDHWLATHTTCPLCRLSLLSPAKPPPDVSNAPAEASYRSSNAENNNETSSQSGSRSSEVSHSSQQYSVPGDSHERVLDTRIEAAEGDSVHVLVQADQELRNDRTKSEGHQLTCVVSV